jgi:hypothetical protein
MKCGREPTGAQAGKFGVCPAALESRLDGIHHGENAGRVCWMVAGTMCTGEVQGTFARKYKECQDCVFFKLVRIEEGEDFMADVSRLVEYF